MHAIDLALLTALCARASTIHAAVAERQLARRPRRPNRVRGRQP